MEIKLIMKLENIKPGIILQHHSGRIYTVIHLANNSDSNIHKDIHPPSVIFQGTNGNIWSRPLSEFDGKYTVLHINEKSSPALFVTNILE